VNITEFLTFINICKYSWSLGVFRRQFNSAWPSLCR